jgi:hypothetical protein
VHTQDSIKCGNDIIFDSETTADLLIWLRDEVLGENDWSALSEQIASNMKQINESYFKKVLSIVE